MIVMVLRRSGPEVLEVHDMETTVEVDGVEGRKQSIRNVANARQ